MQRIAGQYADRKQAANMPSIPFFPPPPDTVSTAAREALRNRPRAPRAEDLEIHPGMCAAVQRDLGAIQLARHGGRMEERAVDSVPVRVVTPPDVSDTS